MSCLGLLPLPPGLPGNDDDDKDVAAAKSAVVVVVVCGGSIGTPLKKRLSMTSLRLSALHFATDASPPPLP
jgi:hypothetical protein